MGADRFEDVRAAVRDRAGILLLACIIAASIGYVASTFSSSTPTSTPTSGASLAPSAASVPVAGNLTGVSCVSPSSCTAVGNNAGAAGTPSETAIGDPLIEHFDGSSWSVERGVIPSSVAPLGALACPLSSLCEVGGYVQTAAGFDYTFTEAVGSARHVLVPSETPTGAVVNLDGISCLSSSSCFASGDNGISISAPEYGFIESFNGSAWSVVSRSRDAGINALSCATTTFCVAVGNNFALNASPIELYNGNTWSFGPSPVPGGYVYLNGVSCTSSTFCVAVGAYGLGDVGSLIETYDGTKWSVVDHPEEASYLRAVSCTSATFCVAVGNLGSVLDNSSPSIAEVFNGHSWSVTPNPNLPNGSTLGGVSCASSSFCMAVGNRAPSVAAGGTSEGLIESFNGRTWAISQP